MHFRVFFKVNRDFFVVANISIFLGCLKFLIFFFGGGGVRYMLGPSLRMKK